MQLTWLRETRRDGFLLFFDRINKMDMLRWITGMISLMFLDMINRMDMMLEDIQG